MPEEPSREGLTILVVPDGGGETRKFRIPPGRVPLVRGGIMVGIVVLVALAGSWWYLAAQAARANALQAEIDSLRVVEERVEALARQLEEVEDRYSTIRDMFGPLAGAPSEVWLPPPGGGEVRDQRGDEDGDLPTTWPLTERGFVTQPLMEDASGEHPGMDVAVPRDSYIRAAGPGRVEEVAEDPVYGVYLVLDHGNGYRTRYAHASRVLVEEGDPVRRREVVALSGSTGRSTAPHLHFEILRDGEPVDPMTLLRPP